MTTSFKITVLTPFLSVVWLNAMRSYSKHKNCWKFSLFPEFIIRMKANPDQAKKHFFYLKKKKKKKICSFQVSLIVQHMYNHLLHRQVRSSCAGVEYMPWTVGSHLCGAFRCYILLTQKLTAWAQSAAGFHTQTCRFSTMTLPFLPLLLTDRTKKHWDPILIGQCEKS